MTTSDSAENAPRKIPQLGRNERRVLGVLVEKAKTTPENYPMSIAAIVSASNQKTNRSPVMQLDEDDVQMALDKLRALGATLELQGSGRVSKFKHCAYEFLGVDAGELAIMTELLLRGPQTAGELRARAARMHALPDLETVVAIIDELSRRGLIQALTPPGRGQTFAHTTYPPDEQRYLAAKVEKFATESDAEASDVSVATRPPAHESRLAAMEARLEELQTRLDELELRITS